MRLHELIEIYNNLAKTQSLISEKIIVHDWKSLVEHGIHTLAMRAYYNQNKNSTLSEAKKVCDEYRDLLNSNDQ